MSIKNLDLLRDIRHAIGAVNEWNFNLATAYSRNDWDENAPDVIDARTERAKATGRLEALLDLLSTRLP